MLTNQISKIFAALIVLAVVLATASFVTHSASLSTNRAYDGIEQIHAARSFDPHVSSYDPIENIRAERTLKPAISSYDILEQLRNARGLSADRSYDMVEELRAFSNSVFSDNASIYDQIEKVRTQRVLNLTAADSYSALEQLRGERGLKADSSYDQIESLRLVPIAPFTTGSSYDLIEQLRMVRGLTADRTYDLIETLRLQP